MACTKVSYESEFAQSPYLTFGQNLQFTLKCMSRGESLDDLACPAQSIAFDVMSSVGPNEAFSFSCASKLMTFLELSLPH